VAQPHASIFTRTCPEPSSGIGTCSTVKGLPKPWTTAARQAVGGL
jgi:hypothetical protein